MSTACGRPQGEGVRSMWTHVDRGRGAQKPDFCGRHKWMTLGESLVASSDHLAQASSVHKRTREDEGKDNEFPQHFRQVYA